MTATGTHWRLPYRAWETKVPSTEQDRREAMVETIITAYIEDDDEVTFEQLLVIRPDLTHSQLWEAVEHLCGLSGEVAFWENQPGREAFDLAVDEYVGALHTFARLPVAVSS